MTSGNTFEQEWRANVTSQLKESGEAISAARVAFEKLLVRVEDHDRRIERLENAQMRVADRALKQADEQPRQFARVVRDNLGLIISAAVAVCYVAQLLGPHLK